MIRIELVVVAQQGQNEPDAVQPRQFRSSSRVKRIPLPPEHLYRPGKGQTLCQLPVDQSWERFPNLDGRMSHATCPTCAEKFALEHSSGR